MNQNTPLIIILMVLWSCANEDIINSDFTGNATTYTLTDVSSQYTGGGTVTLRERRDQSVTIEIDMEPTGSGGTHPAHLHYGTFDIPDAEMAAMLNPVDATNGQSSTVISQLLDGTVMNYQDMLAFDGSIKIHLDDGANKSVVLAAVNIGVNAGISSKDVAVCSSDQNPI